MKEYYTCNIFAKNFDISKKFLVKQKQLVVISELKLKPSNVEYNCKWYAKSIDSEKPFIAIPIRNCSKLLRYTLDNFKENGMFDISNVLVVDDRSTENLKEITDDYPVSFLRVDNEHGFNFSMLNNIAALLSHKLGGKTFVMWNSDLWVDKVEYFKDLLKLHAHNDSTISGSKLLYPIESLHQDEHSDNIKNHFPNKLDGSYKDTVQFGGSRWIPTAVPSTKGNLTCFIPHHYMRFSNKLDSRVNCNYGTEFITGALQVIDLDWFISTGGLNPSLPKNFQDVDICLKAIQDQKKVMYFGKDIHFYHDESYTFYSNKDEKKIDNQMAADTALFEKIWGSEILKLVF
tara:strand:+ start:2783 stop:3817 length:1035 start_codon:yes stop_codon:yes gene_type:complete